MKRVSTAHFGVLGGALLLVALVLALALPGVAGAARAPIDGTAPVTTVNSVDAVGGAITLVFVPVDYRSAVTATFYRIDGGAWIMGTSVTVRPTILHKRAGLARGMHTVAYFSIDAANNVELVKSTTIII